MMSYLIGQAFNYSTFAHAWFAYDYRIVLFASAKDLYNTQDFLLTTYNGVQTALCCYGSKVCAEIINNRGVVLTFSFAWLFMLLPSLELSLG